MAIQTQIRLLGQLTPISIRESFFNDCVDVWVGDRIWTFYRSATIWEIQEVLEEGLRSSLAGRIWLATANQWQARAE